MEKLREMERAEALHNSPTYTRYITNGGADIPHLS